MGCRTHFGLVESMSSAQGGLGSLAETTEAWVHIAMIHLAPTPQTHLMDLFTHPLESLSAYRSRTCADGGLCTYSWSRERGS